MLFQGNTRLLSAFSIFVLVIVGLCWWGLRLAPFVAKNSNTSVACSEEAKICPDGSAVGRTGPNCEFEACPNSNVNVGTDRDCLITGCSGQVCAGAEITTTCEMKPEYVCYDSATCERQPSGICGWTMTDALQQCLIRLTTP